MRLHAAALATLMLISGFTYAESACYQHQGKRFCFNTDQAPQPEPTNNTSPNTIYQDSNGNSTRCFTDDVGNRSCTQQNGNVTRTYSDTPGKSSQQLYDSRVIRSVGERVGDRPENNTIPSQRCRRTHTGKMVCN